MGHALNPFLNRKEIPFVCVCLFRATPMAYGSSQARGPIRAAAATATAMQDPSRICNLHLSSQQCRFLNPLSEVRDQTLWFLVGFVSAAPQREPWPFYI